MTAWRILSDILAQPSRFRSQASIGLALRLQFVSRRSARLGCLGCCRLRLGRPDCIQHAVRAWPGFFLIVVLWGCDTELRQTPRSSPDPRAMPRARRDRDPQQPLVSFPIGVNSNQSEFLRRCPHRDYIACFAEVSGTP